VKVTSKSRSLSRRKSSRSADPNTRSSAIFHRWQNSASRFVGMGISSAWHPSLTSLPQPAQRSAQESIVIWLGGMAADPVPDDDASLHDRQCAVVEARCGPSRYRFPHSTFLKCKLGCPGWHERDDTPAWLPAVFQWAGRRTTARTAGSSAIGCSSLKWWTSRESPELLAKQIVKEAFHPRVLFEGFRARRRMISRFSANCLLHASSSARRPESGRQSHLLRLRQNADLLQRLFSSGDILSSLSALSRRRRRLFQHADIVQIPVLLVVIQPVSTTNCPVSGIPRSSRAPAASAARACPAAPRCGWSAACAGPARASR